MARFFFPGEDDPLSSNPKDGPIMRPGKDGPILSEQRWPLFPSPKMEGAMFARTNFKEMVKGPFLLGHPVYSFLEPLFPRVITSTRPLLRDLLFSLSMLEILE